MSGDNLQRVFFLTLIYFFIELIGGIYYNSLALVTDAAFMATNVAGQLTAIFAKKLSQRPPDKTKTFGYERAKVLAGLFNGMLVSFVLFYVFINAYQRIIEPQPIEAKKVLYIAILGLAINGYGLYALKSELQDINVKGSFLHLLTDTLGSFGVIISSLVITYTNFYQMDALASIAIGILVGYPTYFLVKDSLHILMEGAPTNLDVDDIKKFISTNFKGKVKNMHVWVLTPDKAIMVGRIETPARTEIASLKSALKSKFGFYDVFLEIYEGEGNVIYKNKG